MKAIYRTVSFWACIVMAWINMVLLFIGKHLHNPGIQGLALATMALCLVGAGSHWYLDRYFGAKNERRAPPRR